MFTAAFVQNSIPNYLLNRLDLLIIHYTSKLRVNPLRWRDSHAHKYQISRQAFEKVLLMLSDQQLVTGVVILMVAFMKHESLTQYHFFVVAILGWLSYSTH